MKTRYWAGLLILLFLLCTVLSLPLLLPGENARYAQISSEGRILCTLDLKKDQQLHVTTAEGGSNTVTVKDGRIGVTQASCPDHLCMDRGMCSSGAQIVCLPNRLVIRFLGAQELDSVAG